VSVNDVTGDIVLCSHSVVNLFTINGAPIVSKNLAEMSGEDTIFSCAFYEGLGNEWLQRELLFTGHRRGLVKV